MVIYQTIIYLGFIVLIGVIFYSLYCKKNITKFLQKIFSLAFWLSIVFLIFSISIQIFTNNGEIKINEKNSLNSSHYSNGYNVPVKIHLSFRQKKIYKGVKKDTLSGKSSSISISRLIDENDNNLKSEFYKNSMFTDKEIDSIFKFSPDVKIIGKKLKIDYWKKNNNNFTTNTSSFITNGVLNIKSTNWFFTICQIIGNYLSFIILVLIFYQLKEIFTILNNKITFSIKLTKHINLTGLLIIIWQLLKALISIIYISFYSFAGFENSGENLGIQLNINPRIEFDLVLIFIGLGLLVLSLLLKKGNALQNENELTI